MNKRYFLIFLAIFSLGIASGIIFVNVKNEITVRKKQKPTFFTIKKNQQTNVLTKQEEDLYNKIERSNQKFKDSLKKEELEALNQITEYVKAEIEKNPTVQIKYKEIFKNKLQSKVYNKLKQYRKGQMLVKDKKLFKQMLSKLDTQEIAELYMGIK